MSLLAQIPIIFAQVIQKPLTREDPMTLWERLQYWYEWFQYYWDVIMGIDFEDKLFIYGTLLLFTWICNTGIVMQLQYKKQLAFGKLALYSVMIPVALFMIVIPILMYFEVWANYRALVITVIASNFFIYYVTRTAVDKKQRLVNFSMKLDEAREELIGIIDKSDPETNSDKIKALRKELDEFGPKYYNGV